SQLEASNYQIFPNPVSTGTITLQGDFDLAHNAQISIVDLLGRTFPINNEVAFSNERQSIQLEVSHLPTGFYYLQIQPGLNNGITLPFIKQ
ncbi:MAG: T9SS type A sorting domain-containing protein, partial [Bacteroidota bacterium]